VEQFRRKEDKDYRHALRHSAAHLMAQAVIRLYPKAQLTVGPANDEGFFYDIDLAGQTLAPEDLQKIEAEMKKISKEDHKVRYSEKSRSEAKDFLKSKGQIYKIEMVDWIPEGEAVSFYEQGEFIDLCEGPHVRSTGEIKHFRLLNFSGAYWKGDQNNAQLQRIYGTAFESKELLDAHLKMLEEAAKRDHREVGKRLDLFSFHEWAPGIPFFHPKGTTVFNLMADYIRQLYLKYGYQEVLTPLIYDQKLYETSGHMETFKQNMFIMKDDDDRSMCLKPMNCPGHCLYYRGKLWSYKELPVRVAEFSKLHRNERSGALHGVMRVRAMSQDDAHIFCREDQIEAETEGFFEFLNEVYRAFGFNEYEVKLATRPDQKIGSDELWDRAEKTLEHLLIKRRVPYKISPGEGAFYGPKYEFHIKDAIGRSWQLATLQLDFALPMRFELEYVGEDGKRHRPVMLHRAIFGSLERFFGVYLEHCEGFYPTWLAPTQVYIVPVRDAHYAFADEVADELKKVGVRVICDKEEGNMGGKVRKATVARVPYVAVIGDREVEARSLAIKTSKNVDLGMHKKEAFISSLLQEIDCRSLENFVKKPTA
jgi:threonyl-tRNA synthetase